MNIYAVAMNEVRTWYDYYQETAPETGLDIGIYAAETRGQAKADAFRDFQDRPQSTTYSDDWNSLRTLLLKKNVRGIPRGKVENDHRWWGKIPLNWPIPL